MGAAMVTDQQQVDQDREETARPRVARKPWQEPELVRRETLPRITNGFAGSFPPKAWGDPTDP